MNHKFVLYTALSCLLCFNSCKKDPKGDPETEPQTTVLSCDLNTPTFSVALNSSDRFYDIYEDLERNILLLGQNSVMKYNYTGNLVWSKAIASAGIPQNIIQADGDNYFTTSSTIEVKSLKDNELYLGEGDTRQMVLTAYFNAYSSLDKNCFQYYNLVKKSFGDNPDTLTGVVSPPSNNSKCFLNKIDKDGNVLWTKTFDGNYFEGKSICKTADNNYALLTYKMHGVYRTAIFNANGVFMDTIYAPLDKNTITVHKLDHSGNIIWSKTIEGIINETFSDYVNGGAKIVSLQNNLFIQTTRKIIVLDAAGNTVKEMKPYGNNCAASADGFTVYNDHVYSTGSLSASAEGSAFISSFDANGNLFQTIPLSTGLGAQSNIFVMSDGIMCVWQRGIKKVDMTNTELWQLSMDNVSCVNQTCRDGAICVGYNNGSLQLIKTNRNGVY
jgi:hypothetical protein